jgi:hypothetical protein
MPEKASVLRILSKVKLVKYNLSRGSSRKTDVKIFVQFFYLCHKKMLAQSQCLLESVGRVRRFGQLGI